MEQIWKFKWKLLDSIQKDFLPHITLGERKPASLTSKLFFVFQYPILPPEHMQWVDTLYALLFWMLFRKVVQSQEGDFALPLSSWKGILVTAALSEMLGLLAEQELWTYQVVLAEPSSCRAHLGIWHILETEVNNDFAVTSLISCYVFK